ncbi:MAG: glycyl-radical enzyme activating protein [Candidatus Aminicenantes bacterium]|nr:MAG: glycyl-radical enzyme activating protein [Candidatus Aminicenantes bacterium]
MVTGIIFDLKRYAIHDGPGIRTTVFFKGCPLHCAWCHNPEGIDPQKELFFRAEKCAPDCRRCLEACPQQALIKIQQELQIDRSACDGCGKCAEVCMYEAIEVVGEKMSVPELMAELAKDEMFFQESGGGVTISGGEPFLQPAFLDELLKACRQRGWTTAVDTSGYVDFSFIERELPWINYLLYDLKIMDESKHVHWTGVSNKLILDNLSRLASRPVETFVRVPLIAGVSDDDENIEALISFLAKYPQLKKINLLVYHSGWTSKMVRLGKTCWAEFNSPSKERVQEIKTRLEKEGFEVKIGG